jgi:20S proteasome alpha/beta subunit
MTICIAALYDNGKGCILCSDEMVTAHIPMGYEYESDDVEKIISVCKSSPVHVLVAGDVLAANEMIELARKEAEAKGITNTSGIAELLRKAYQTVRRTVIIHNELEPRGLDLSSFHGLHQRLLPQVVQMIDRAFAEFNARVDFILAGKDENQFGIYSLSNPGQLSCHNPIGYATVGSGSPHAIYSIIDSKYKKSMTKEIVENIVRAAKKRSEVAPGVGPSTTLKSFEM